ncbi:helix-turn-helix domain-containing protein [Streptococcus pluranimalium]|uniref:helix-turn-helix domain-containing protein n=1 Tax=Streptococcus pluranimalium TaxID=82348 RepID=UPI003F66CC4D
MLRLKELRKEKGITLKELSRILKERYNLIVSDGQLSNYENEKRRPRDESIWNDIADYFEVPVPYLLGYVDSPVFSMEDFVYNLNAQNKGRSEVTNFIAETSEDNELINIGRLKTFNIVGKNNLDLENDVYRMLAVAPQEYQQLIILWELLDNKEKEAVLNLIKNLSEK